ncbi:pseudoazurin [Microvirga pudoricolor]|uniref:pseudoazurin n=1 Tax=Microvirga pudoricolor TaxID=2778729 RepID=UPI00194EA2CA|nr:pseudoazurin [Microvirga pudoricolor]MBM6595601.1 pseudoazurin [Microvirga pudoricolor]
MRLPTQILALWLILPAHGVRAETYEVRMLNGSERGSMLYEPDHLSIEPGDTVKFLATQRGHNAATVDGFLPDGAKPFKGQINQEIEVTFTVPGLYGIKCSPHYDMGMVMLIQVGKAPVDEARIPGGLPRGPARRFSEILSRANAR